MCLVSDYVVQYLINLISVKSHGHPIRTYCMYVLGMLKLINSFIAERLTIEHCTTEGQMTEKTSDWTSYNWTLNNWTSKNWRSNDCDEQLNVETAQHWMPLNVKKLPFNLKVKNRPTSIFFNPHIMTSKEHLEYVIFMNTSADLWNSTCLNHILW
jgi:hypothetical protein